MQAPGAAAKAKVAPKSAAQSVKVPPAQRQFLVIEAAGTTRDTEVLALPGRVTFRPQAQSAVGATAPPGYIWGYGDPLLCGTPRPMAMSTCRAR